MARIGLIQLDKDMDGDIGLRQNAIMELARKCLDEGADLVFFPEAFQYDKCRELTKDTERLSRVAEEWRERCAELARRYHAYVVPWDYYVGEDGGVRNSSYILDREGNFVGRYCKCNLTRSELERGLVKGTELPVFDLDIGKVGILICFDNYFPEVAAALGNRGAELILYPLYGDTLLPQWEMKLRTRAIDHSLYMAACQIDKREAAYTGMVDPEGNVIAKLRETGSWCVVDIEMGREVRTNTAAIPDFPGEDLREYLHKCRNYKAFSALAEEGTAPLEWDEIFHG